MSVMLPPLNSRVYARMSSDLILLAVLTHLYDGCSELIGRSLCAGRGEEVVVSLYVMEMADGRHARLIFARLTVGRLKAVFHFIFFFYKTIHKV